MKQIIKKIAANGDYRQLSVNILSMLTIQGSNFLVPLITFPYLIRTLGIESYGLMTFTQNIVSYGEQFIAYGFVLTGPRDIAQVENDKKELSRRFFAIFYSRLLFGIFSAFVISILCFLIPKFEDIKATIFIGFSMLLALILQIEWFFQGVQQMKNITLVNLMARFISLIFLFYLVKTPNDAAFGILSIALSQIIANSFSWFLAFKHHGLQFIPPQYFDIKTQIQTGFNVFLSQFLVRFYSSDVNITILGLVSNNLAVGTYQFAYRIFLLTSAIATPPMAALYPYLAKLFHQDYAKFWRQIVLISKAYFLSYLFFTVVLFFAADFLVTLIGSKENVEVVFTLRLLCMGIVIVPFSPLFTQVLLLHDKSNWLLYNCLIGIVINFIALISFYYYLGKNALPITNGLVMWVLFFIQFLLLLKLFKKNLKK